MNYDQIGKQYVSRRKPSPLRKARPSRDYFETKFSQKVERRHDRPSGFAGAATRKKVRRVNRARPAGFKVTKSLLQNLGVIVLVLAIGIVGTQWDSISGGFEGKRLSSYNIHFPVDYPIIDARIDVLSSLVQAPSADAEEKSTLIFEEVPINLTETFDWFSYIVERGDSISRIAARYSLNQGSIISLNKLKNAWNIKTGMSLKIPNMDGISYTVQKNDSISKIATNLKVPQNAILDANDIRNDVLLPGQELFIPGAVMNTKDFSNAVTRPNEKPMIRPAIGKITSGYGWREDPVNPRPGEMRFHRALDIAGKVGDPIKAALGGTVLHIGTDRNLGHFIILKHDRYQTLYAHLSAFSVAQGETVRQGQEIGKIGNTGYTTGPHLHFEVFQNGNRINPLDVIR